MSDLKQMSQAPLKQKPAPMSRAEVTELVAVVQDDLQKQVDDLKMKLLLLEGKLSAEMGVRGLDEEPITEELKKSLKALGADPEVLKRKCARD